jgi:nucleoid-associated protein YgaU
MSIRRLVLTAAAMAAIAAALGELTPAFPALTESLIQPQATVDRAGPDALVVAAAGLLAWLVWAWGAVGLALTAASALPGLLGGAARLALGVVLPAGARRSAAVLLGLGLGVAGPLMAGTFASAPSASASVTVLDRPAPPPAAENRQPGPVPDWPASEVPATDAVPDWPPGATGDVHVVVRGECLWSIAEDRLLRRNGRAPTAAEVATTVRAWWTANEAVIGADPDRILPGQVLRPPP